MNILDEQRWASMNLAQQMANIGSEVGRSAKWLSKKKPAQAEGAFLRALDLIDITIKYGRIHTSGRQCLLKELCRARECYVDAYQTCDYTDLASMERYFCSFASICRKGS